MRWINRVALALCAAALAVGCGDDVGGETIFLDLPPIPLENGHEITDLCFSWTLENEEPLYVNTVRMRGTRGIHHSNWFYVTEDTFRGPDGEWPCHERGFDTALAALSGGVLFAQSTQALDETQAFDRGVVMRIPPRSRVVVDLHLINTYGEDLLTDIELTIEAIPASRAHTFLTGFALTYNPLTIQPQTRSEFTMECDFSTAHWAALGRALDFRVHYVLPHYHALGDMLRLEVVGGPRDGELLWEVTSAIGDVLGGIPDATLATLDGATGLRMTCGFENPRDEVVRAGVGDQEMCITFGFTDSERMWSGVVTGADQSELVDVTADGTHVYEGQCTVIQGIPLGSLF
jgi:hypothetical protein